MRTHRAMSGREATSVAIPATKAAAVITVVKIPTVRTNVDPSLHVRTIWRAVAIPCRGGLHSPSRVRTWHRRHRVDLWDTTRLVHGRRFDEPRRMSVSASLTRSSRRGFLRSSPGRSSEPRTVGGPFPRAALVAPRYRPNDETKPTGPAAARRMVKEPARQARPIQTPSGRPDDRACRIAPGLLAS
jgi:hypothetical protein